MYFKIILRYIKSFQFKLEKFFFNNTDVQNVIRFKNFQKESILSKFSKKNTTDSFYNKTADGLIIESVHIIITSLLQWFQQCIRILLSYGCVTSRLNTIIIARAQCKWPSSAQNIHDSRPVDEPRGHVIVWLLGLECQPMHERIYILLYCSCYDKKKKKKLQVDFSFMENQTSISAYHIISIYYHQNIVTRKFQNIISTDIKLNVETSSAKQHKNTFPENNIKKCYNIVTLWIIALCTFSMLSVKNMHFQ